MNTYPVATGVRLMDGAELVLPPAVELSITSSLDSPVDALEAVFAPENPEGVAADPGELGSVSVTYQNRALFEGAVDRQTAMISAQGYRLAVSARSKGALLLDNEAIPCVMTGVHAQSLFHRCIAPYGFVLYNPNPAYALTSWTVRKDTGEWEVFADFTRRVYGITPYVRGDQVVVDVPRASQTLVISNTGEGLRYTALEYRRTPYAMISQVLLRDADGGYGASVTNSDAAYYGVRRRRCVIPSNEYTDNPGMDANRRIRRSMRDVTRIVVTLPGLIETQTGQGVIIRDRALERSNLIIDELTWRVGANGLTTRLSLTDSRWL